MAPYRPLTPVATAVALALASVAVINVVQILLVVREVAAGAFFARAEPLAVLMTGGLFAALLAAATRNASAFAPRALGFSPVKAALTVLVPVLNLFLPYAALTDIWRASAPEPAQRLGRTKSPPLLRWWWGLVLARVVAAVVGERQRQDGDEAGEIVIAGAALSIAAALTGIAVVRALDRRQRQRASQRPADAAAL